MTHNGFIATALGVAALAICGCTDLAIQANAGGRRWQTIQNPKTGASMSGMWTDEEANRVAFSMAQAQMNRDKVVRAYQDDSEPMTVQTVRPMGDGDSAVIENTPGRVFTSPITGDRIFWGN